MLFKLGDFILLWFFFFKFVSFLEVTFYKGEI